VTTTSGVPGASLAHGSTPISSPPTILELQSGASVPFEELLNALYVLHYTGIVTVDFRSGCPFFYALGRPRRGKIVVP